MYIVRSGHHSRPSMRFRRPLSTHFKEHLEAAVSTSLLLACASDENASDVMVIAS